MHFFVENMAKMEICLQSLTNCGFGGRLDTKFDFLFDGKNGKNGKNALLTPIATVIETAELILF
jgi:hypothetical protein